MLLERLIKDWNAPVYAFFRPTPSIMYIDDHQVHVFTCNAKTCKRKGKNGQEVWRYLNTADALSMSNLRWHAKICWGEEIVAAVSNTKDVHATRGVLAKMSLSRNGSITATFQREGKVKVMYSHRQHMRIES